MTSLTNAIGNLLYDKNEFCRLCLGIVGEETLRMQDEVMLKENNGEELGNILAFIFGPEITTNFVGLDRVCDQCVKSALSSYAFISSCKNNLHKLTNAIDCITNCLDNSLIDARFKTIFFTVNTDNAENNVYYDKNKCQKKPSNVIKRLKSKRFDNLQVHYRNMHNKSRLTSEHNGVVCSCCGKTFKNKKSVRVHERNHSLRFRCEKCTKVYKTKSFFLDHVCRLNKERGPLEKNYKCDDCGVKFVRKATLRLHIKFEHGNGIPHVCSYCNKRFYAQSTLNVHMVKHTKDKNYKCEMCNGQFVTKSSLIYHVRTHTGEKPYKCKYCDMKFLSTSRRADHTRRHHKEPSLSCIICSKKFAGYQDLNRHRQRHLDPNSSLYVVE